MRLTKKGAHGKPILALDQDGVSMDDAIEKLAMYEDAEEQGRLATFPLGLGDTIYEVVEEYSKVIEKTVYGFRVDEGPVYLNVGHDVYFNSAKIGEIFFATREEAEAKLKKLEGKK